MCIWIPPDATPRQRAALEAFARAQESMMASALSRWTEQDWADVEYGANCSDEEYAVFARQKGWES